MANTIDSAFQPISEYLISVTRNTTNGNYELQVGIPNKWVFDDNAEIECDVMKESDVGRLIKVAPKKSKIIIDDLVRFVEIIIKTNERIAEKEKEFTKEMENMRGILEKKANKFYEELDELKDTSFQKAGEQFVEELNADAEPTVPPKRKVGRPKGSTTTKKPVAPTEAKDVTPA